MIRSTDYIFNESKNRLEPVETFCNYCGADVVSSMEENYFVPMYKVTKDFDIFIYRSATYATLTIGTPRCHSCYKIHQSANWKAPVYCFGTAGLITFFAYLIFAPAVLIALPGLIYAGIIIPLVNDKIVAAKKIPTKIEGASKSTAVKIHLEQGWVFKNPSEE